MSVADYTEQVLKVEPKGVEPISPSERHGRPSSIFSLWFGANVEFATLVTGALATGAFGLSFWQAVLAIGIGNLLGALALGALSTFGPRFGVPQLIQSRKAFGYYGNFIPGVLNFIAGFSWFAVNTVLGVFALQWLFGLSFAVGLGIMVVIQVAIAVYGYNLIHTLERYLAVVLTVVFLIVSVYGFANGHLSAPMNLKLASYVGGPSGAFILMLAISFSYCLGWMAFASDYTRYLPAKTSVRAVFGNAFWSLLISGFWLEVLGAALATLKNIAVPTDLVTHLLPHALGVVTMIAVVLGTVTANVLNIYSGALSSLVIDIPMKRWLGAVIVGILGTIVSWVAGQHGYWQHYQEFLFLLGYWVAPWLAIVLVDYYVKAKGQYETEEFYNRKQPFAAGVWAWIIGVAVSVPFMNQYPVFVSWFPSHYPQFGDITYFVSFVVAGLVYLVMAKSRQPQTV
ncbi:MAG: cytosine permease [Thermaerobacter sp.]|nr:cytosine permease [Thermaerobacter sp.]